MDKKMKSSQYYLLAIMVVISFVSMYVLMYAMVNVFGNVYSSFNQFYMAGLMTAPMIIIEMCVMGAMYNNKKLNGFIIAFQFIFNCRLFFTPHQRDQSFQCFALAASRVFLKRNPVGFNII